MCCLWVTLIAAFYVHTPNPVERSENFHLSCAQSPPPVARKLGRFRGPKIIQTRDPTNKRTRRGRGCLGSPLSYSHRLSLIWLRVGEYANERQSPDGGNAMKGVGVNEVGPRQTFPRRARGGSVLKYTHFSESNKRVLCGDCNLLSLGIFFARNSRQSTAPNGSLDIMPSSLPF